MRKSEEKKAGLNLCLISDILLFSAWRSVLHRMDQVKTDV